MKHTIGQHTNYGSGLNLTPSQQLWSLQLSESEPRASSGGAPRSRLILSPSLTKKRQVDNFHSTPSLKSNFASSEQCPFDPHSWPSYTVPTSRGRILPFHELWVPSLVLSLEKKRGGNSGIFKPIFHMRYMKLVAIMYFCKCHVTTDLEAQPLLDSWIDHFADSHQRCSLSGCNIFLLSFSH